MSVSKRIKYFKQIAILLTFFWTLLTTIFVVYQFYNEEKHIEESSLEKIKGVAEQSVAFVYWAYEQKARALSDEQKYSIRSNFSLKELLSVLAKHSNMELDIASISKDLHAFPLKPTIKKALTQMKESEEDRFALFEKEGEKHLFYVKPMPANNACIMCHVHNDKKVGELIGYTTLEMKVPTFKEANPQTFYFLIGTYLGTWLLGLFAIWWIHSRGRNYLNEKTKMYEESMYALIDMVEKRDSYTAGHSQRVAEYSKMLVMEMGYSGDDVDFIYKAGMLHDIGKIEIPDAILLKPDKLNEMEYSLIKRHSTASYELLSREPFSLLSTVVLHHHERYDGKGYPDGLTGEQIPIAAQVVSVADVYDALVSKRVYKDAYSHEQAMKMILNGECGAFNPLLMEVLVEIQDKIKEEIRYEA